VVNDGARRGFINVIHVDVPATAVYVKDLALNFRIARIVRVEPGLGQTTKQADTVSVLNSSIDPSHVLILAYADWRLLTCCVNDETLLRLA
jgi:hypothetical protein